MCLICSTRNSINTALAASVSHTKRQRAQSVLGSISKQREPRREPNRKRDVEPVRGRQRSNRDERGKTVALSRLPRDTNERVDDVVASSSRPKPVRRDILAELESCRANEVEPSTGNSSTKEWVRRMFAKDEPSGATLQVRDAGDRRGLQPETKRAKPRAKSRAPWYRATEEEAAIANEVIFQKEKWEAAEKSQVPVKQIVTSEVEGDERVARVSTDVPKPMELGLGAGPENEEAQQAEDSLELVDQGTESHGLGLHSNFSPTDIISPLKG
ncbi:hypothetical protein AALP_AAs67696U000300 [Arabis alpina]|uniref:Uncharacterized protein n=1 Tax=Arabis alpina TaxID=50452 RepID=A0A087G0W3_ARAAL|nr:hypothetical protein AALP_AAs67696U000300 [Arabis alpina]